MRGESVLGAVRSAIRVHGAPSAAKKGSAVQVTPVITISREAGTQASDVCSTVVSFLNEHNPGPQPWIEYDKKLVERVAQDHDLSEQLVEAVQERDRSFIERFASGLTGSTPDMQVAMKLAQTVRGLAAVGRCVIVGRGGQAILFGLPNVVHVRLVAPEAWRIEQYAKLHELTPAAARSQVRQIDNDRTRFVRNHFNRDPKDLALYDLVVNMAATTPEKAARAIAQMVL
jgi:cytidylate kinase